MLTETKDLHVSTKAKLSEKRTAFIHSFIQEMFIEHLLIAKHSASSWAVNKIEVSLLLWSLQSSGRNKQANGLLWMFIQPPA